MGPAQPLNLASQTMPHSAVGPGDEGLPLMRDSPPTVPQLRRAGRRPQAASRPPPLSAPSPLLPSGAGLKASPSALGRQIPKRGEKGCCVRFKLQHNARVTPELAVSPRH